MDEVRLGTVGTGAIVRSILDNVRKIDGIRLEAVCSRDAARARALADEYGAISACTDVDALLRDPAVNLVYIATPNSLHYGHAKAALLAGKNVMLEKPFCPRLSQARELVELARRGGLLIIDAVPTAFLPNLALLRRELPKVGNIKLVLANYTQYSARYDRLLSGQTPNVFSAEYAGGCLMDINFYNIYLNIALFGKPQDVAYYPNLYEGKIDTSGVALMTYPGFVSVSAGSKDAHGASSFRIEGDRGYIHIPGGSNGISSVHVVTADEDITLNDQPNPDRWYYEVRAITELLLSGRREELSARLGATLATVETLETARRGAGILFPGDT